MRQQEYTHFCYMMIVAVLLSLLLSSPCAKAEIPQSNSAVIYVYQRVNEDSALEGNVSLEQFQEHITELKNGGYTVLPLTVIIDSLKEKKELPQKAVGITFDGAYQATLATVTPILEEAKLPFTVFFASDMADNSSPGYMNWSELKKLKKRPLISLGILPAAYDYMVNQSAEQNSALINRAVGRYREVLKEEPVFFAYPYGEYNNAVKNQLASYNFKGIFGQQSGVVDAHADFLALPRFTMTATHGGLDRFTLTANALPLRINELVPSDTILDKNPPVIGFTVAPDMGNLARLSCFASSAGKLPLVRMGNNRIEIRPETPFIDRRTRINCTLPTTSSPAKIWRWFGMLLISPAMAEDTAIDATEQAGSPESQ